MTETKSDKIKKSKSEWREQLTPDQFYVTRQAGTEHPFTGRFWNHKTPGLYVCVCCGHPLFHSDTKFESGTGWPSFTEPVAPDVIAYHGDHSFGMVRVETTCNVCDAHLGHVFPDGPPPTGLRYCMNAVALKKVEEPGPAG
jgi:methionine-R-sulfoxide reductase